VTCKGSSLLATRAPTLDTDDLSGFGPLGPNDREIDLGINSDVEIIRQVADSWYVFVSHQSWETRSLECPCYPPFAGFIGEELLTWLASDYIDFTRIKRRVLAGVSYTGLAAAFVVKEYPGSFQRLICQSGSFWWNDCWLVEEFRRLGQKIPAGFYLDVGTQEINENVRHGEDLIQVVSQIEGVRRFRDALLAQGSAVRYQEFDGGHDYACWNRTLGDALKWAVPLEAEK
jgi:enterochelin esterase-like enzyme